MDLEGKIREIATSHLKDEQFFIVAVRVSPRKVTITLDSDLGATIDDCAELSRAISGVLDEEELLGENYVLDVSTPGIDQPLQLKRQYKKNIGRELKVFLKDQREVKGKLVRADEEGIDLEVTVKENKKKAIQETSIPFGDIQKAIVQISFN